ncbi:hypothetical protein LINPERPRIM_LOCUS28365 [Linum perenne]
MGVVLMCACGRPAKLYGLQDPSVANPHRYNYYFGCYKRNGGCSCFMWCKLRDSTEDGDEYVETYDDMIIRNLELEEENERLRYRIRRLESDTDSNDGFSS